jgi:hypothetical protein
MINDDDITTTTTTTTRPFKPEELKIFYMHKVVSSVLISFNDGTQKIIKAAPESFGFEDIDFNEILFIDYFEKRKLEQHNFIRSKDGKTKVIEKIIIPYESIKYFSFKPLIQQE